MFQGDEGNILSEAKVVTEDEGAIFYGAKVGWVVTRRDAGDPSLA